MVSELNELLKEDILSLGMRADDARRRVVSYSTVQYQRVHVVPFTEVGEGLIVPDAASELRVMGTPASLPAALGVLARAKVAAGARFLSAFSASEVVERCEAGWGGLSVVAKQLAVAGLRDFAEVPADLLADLTDFVKTMRSHDLLVRRITVANPLGETKVEVLERIRQCKRNVGGFGRVAPLPRNVATDKPTTGYEDLRVVALARLAFNEFSNAAPIFIEVDWSLYGPKLAQVALTFGADFLDAVPATTDDRLGRRRGTVEDVERNIRAAGFEPREASPAA